MEIRRVSRISSLLAKLEEDLKRIMEQSSAPILAYSAGKDSGFLLWKLRELGYNIPVLVFPHFWSNYQKEFLKRMFFEYKLKAFFFRPEFIEHDDQSIYSIYNINGKRMMSVEDIIHADSPCGIDIGNQAIAGVLPHFIWDRIIFGSKAVDIETNNRNIDFSSLGIAECPLWDWTDEEVLEITRSMKIPYDERVYDKGDEKADTGNFVGCMRCLGEKEVFCPKEGRIIKGVYR